MNQNLRVRLRGEAVAAKRQALAQIAIVVQLAVEDDRDVLGFVPEGLVAAGQIDNAQPAHPQCETRRARIAGKKPSSSGPRWPIAAVIARTRDSASVLREAKATPHMPHTLLFDLRGGEEGGARTDSVLPQMEARDSQTAVRIPGKQDPQQQKAQCRRSGERQIEERFAFQQQAPVGRFIPARIDGVKNPTQT